MDKHQIPNTPQARHLFLAAERKIPSEPGVWESGSQWLKLQSPQHLCCSNPGQATSCSQHSSRTSLSPETSPWHCSSASQSLGKHQELSPGNTFPSLSQPAPRHGHPRAVSSPPGLELGIRWRPPGLLQHIPAADHSFAAISSKTVISWVCVWETVVWEEIWDWLRRGLRMITLVIPWLVSHKRQECHCGL